MMPAGRPRKSFDKGQFEKLCSMMCTEEEICGFFDCTPKTLARWCNDTYGLKFSQVYRQKREGGKIALRRYQMELAKKSAAMAIFLGKNYLGQRDKVEYTNEDAIKKLDEVLKQIKGVD